MCLVLLIANSKSFMKKFSALFLCAYIASFISMISPLYVSAAGTLPTPSATPKPSVSVLKKQVFCTKDYLPVCGIDGRTYTNRCVAEQQNGEKVAYKGKCKKALPSLTPIPSQTAKQTPTPKPSIKLIPTKVPTKKPTPTPTPVPTRKVTPNPTSTPTPVSTPKVYDGSPPLMY